MEDVITAGAIKVDNITLVNNLGFGINLKNQMVGITIHEDMMTPFITGKVFISDSNSIAEMLPLIGEEMLIIDMETPYKNDGVTPETFKRHLNCFVYKMEGNEDINISNRLVGLCFISIEGFTDVNTRISHTYKGKISDIANKILKSEPGLKTPKDAIIEETVNDEIFTSNFWSPAQCLYYLSSKALNKQNQPNYVFFENNEGFVFSSLNSLYANNAFASFFKHSKARKPGDTRNIDEDYSTVIDMSTPIFFDYYEKIQSGFYGSSIYHYDVQTKRLNYRNFLTKRDIKTNRLNDNYPFSSNLQFRPESSLSLSVIHKSSYNDSPTLTIDHTVRRMAHLSQLSAFTTNIQVFGRFDYAVGKAVYLTVYKNSSTSATDTDDELIDEMLTGKYLITAITHEITTKNHLCNLELSKDSTIKNLDKVSN